MVEMHWEGETQCHWKVGWWLSLVVFKVLWDMPFEMSSWVQWREQLNKLINEKHLEKCLAQIKQSVNLSWGFQVVLVIKNLPASAGDLRDEGSVPESGRSPGGGHGNPLQYSCLDNHMDRGAWWDTVHRVTKSQIRLKWLSTSTNPTYCYSSIKGSAPFMRQTIQNKEKYPFCWVLTPTPSVYYWLSHFCNSLKKRAYLMAPD